MSNYKCARSLQQLYLQNNQLVSIAYREGFQRLAFLNLLGNRFDDWQTVNELNKFPSLTDLRFRDVPLVVGMLYCFMYQHIHSIMYTCIHIHIYMCVCV
jgi:hypothetical protein